MRRAGKNSQAGVTLIELLIAVTLLSVLSAGMLAALRTGLNALQKGNAKLIDDRRVMGAQRVLQEEIAGNMMVKAPCLGNAEGPAPSFNFFQGEPYSMRLVSTYSLQESWRGHPRILELLVILGENGEGVRLIVNERPYTGPASAGVLCTGVAADPLAGGIVPQFRPIEAIAQSFVLADRLAYCRFSYLAPAKTPDPEMWLGSWVLQRSPIAVRVDMAPIEDNPGRLRPLTVTVHLPVNRDPNMVYVDY